MRILWDERAWEEYLSWQTEDKKTLKRINQLIKDIQRSPFSRCLPVHELQRVLQILVDLADRALDVQNDFDGAILQGYGPVFSGALIKGIYIPRFFYSDLIEAPRYL